MYIYLIFAKVKDKNFLAEMDLNFSQFFTDLFLTLSSMGDFETHISKYSERE